MIFEAQLAWLVETEDRRTASDAIRAAGMRGVGSGTAELQPTQEGAAASVWSARGLPLKDAERFAADLARRPGVRSVTLVRLADQRQLARWAGSAPALKAA